MKHEYTYKAVVVRVIDGDTVDLTVDLGFHMKHNIRTRLRGINAPEVSTEDGRIARQELRTLLPVGCGVLVTTYRDPTDKYGRWLALINFNGQDICEWMVSKGFATSTEEPDAAS